MSSIHEQMRANRAQQAEQRRADRAQQAEIRRADRAAAQEQDRADKHDREQTRQARRQAARARRAAGLAWVAAHPTELLLSVIVVVPGLLAWSAMAAYGSEIYGPMGWGLPLFSEAAMWAFAFATHTARRAGRPRGWLLVGLWVFTAISGVLNFLHGFSGDEGSVTRGVVMALVAMGGPVAHQLITASPMRTRRTRAQRREDALQRRAAGRAARMERAALRTAVGQLDTDGRIRLLHTPGTVILRRTWTGRTTLTKRTVPGLGDDGPDTAAEDLGVTLAGEVEAFLRDTPATLPETPPAPPVEQTPDTTADQRRDTPRKTLRNKPAKPARQPAHRSMDQLREQLRTAAAEGRVDPTSAESIRTALRVGRDRAQQLRDEWNDGGTATPTPA
ncbi:DUF2637 domain-containing protein [Saccharopolyspora cebuensis]|uniref:DUF2637 domain-containing protein n=1 Tax=Saccharopolyspora cebuensis TaxID=418759 RepID=A0ABV4CMM7_9PSEU